MRLCMIAAGQVKISGNNNMKTKGRANSIDEHLGVRLKQKRALLGMSQEKLAEAVGITFQQIQKYENGANRISASRLLEFSKILSTPIEYFYEGFDAGSKKTSYTLAESDQEPLRDAPIDLMQQKETLELVRTYYSLENPKLRKSLMRFIKTMAEDLKDQDDA